MNKKQIKDLRNPATPDNIDELLEDMTRTKQQIIIKTPEAKKRPINTFAVAHIADLENRRIYKY